MPFIKMVFQSALDVCRKIFRVLGIYCDALFEIYFTRRKAQTCNKIHEHKYQLRGVHDRLCDISETLHPIRYWSLVAIPSETRDKRNYVCIAHDSNQSKLTALKNADVKECSVVDMINKTTASIQCVS